MKQYIDKAAVVAEIERIDKSIGCDRFLSEYEKGCNQGKEEVCDILRNFLDTLEVKEVDYGIEVYKYAQENFNVYDDVNQTLQTKENKTLLGRKDFEDIAKHFFELGMAARNKAQKGE